jgi:hypothetical protein
VVFGFCAAATASCAQHIGGGLTDPGQLLPGERGIAVRVQPLLSDGVQPDVMDGAAVR